MKNLVNILSLIIFLNILPETSDGTIRRVPSQYATIQSAINASQTGVRQLCRYAQARFDAVN